MTTRGLLPATDPSVPRDRRHHDLALVPLRLFLGATMVFAGLQKLASRSYLDAGSPAGVGAQMRAAASHSPIGGLVGTTSHHAVLFGLLIAFGELAVGLGTLLGLWTRVAAVGGMALALSFLLAVSWHSSPYSLGPDIVFLAAFPPLALAPPSPWSLDALVARRLVLDDPARGPVPLDERRRRFLETASLAGWVSVVGLFGGGAAAALGRIVGSPTSSVRTTAALRPPTTAPATSAATAPSSTAAAGGPTSTGATTTTSPSTTTTPGTAIGRAADVPVGSSASFVDPGTGAAAIVVQTAAGHYQGCSAVCTHEGCTVQYAGNGTLHCPCHGAEFDLATGAVIQGPARQPLATLVIRSAADGNLYVAT